MIEQRILKEIHSILKTIPSIKSCAIKLLEPLYEPYKQNRAAILISDINKSDLRLLITSDDILIQVTGQNKEDLISSILIEQNLKTLDLKTLGLKIKPYLKYDFVYTVDEYKA